MSDNYLTWLQSKGVSYLFGGKSRIDLPRVLQKLHDLFGIRKLLLEGGGRINGSFLAAGVIDELSILVVPVADGGMGKPGSLRRSPERGAQAEAPLDREAEGRHRLVALPGDLRSMPALTHDRFERKVCDRETLLVRHLVEDADGEFVADEVGEEIESVVELRSLGPRLRRERNGLVRYVGR